ncbi:MAG TPA: SCO family protein [Solirubrobacteraceae bacterium]
MDPDSAPTSSSEPPAPEPPPAPPRRGFDARVLIALVAILVIAGGVAVVTQGSSSSKQQLPGNVNSASSSSFIGSVATPLKPAPSLRLHNYLGNAVNIASYRGKAVLVTFLYTNCPDVCPLITANLRVALSMMSPQQAAKTQVIAVSVDPRGDTSKAVAAFLKRHEMTGRMQYLIGSAHELAHVWQEWNVGSEQDAQQPQLVNHSGLVYGISASGKLTTLYAANFKPSDIAHDAPLLSSQ